MDLRCRFCLFLLLFSFLLIEPIHAQRDQRNEEIGSPGQDSVPVAILPLDTLVPMTYVKMDDLNKSIAFKDTFTWEDNKDYPLHFYEAHLGNYGSATRSLAPVMRENIGFSTGWLQYDRYYIHVDSFRYYNQDVPVSQVKYGQAGQNDTYITIDFGRSFAKGINLSIGYERINQVGEFAHQRQKNTAFSVGIWYDAPGGKYDAFYNYLSNAVTTEENGGIADTTLINDPRYTESSVPVNITGGITNHKHRSFLTKQVFHLTGENADLGIDAWFKAHLYTGLFKYVDEQPTAAADYYGTYFLTDDRGLRQYTYLTGGDWSAGMSLPWNAAHSTLHASLRYRGIDLEQEPVKRGVHELFFDAVGEFQWVEPLILKGQLSLGLAQAQGTFSFKAEADLKTGIAGSLRGHWAVASREPYMNETSLYVTQELVYQDNFNNPFSNEVGVEWNWSRQMFKVGITWLLLDNYVYFDSLRFPFQLDESLSLRRFYLSKDLNWKWGGVKGAIAWQPDPPAELAVPELLYTANLYGLIKIFDRKVTLMPGVDVTYHDGYTGVSYFPVTGTYHLTDGPQLTDYLRVDAGAGIGIKFIKFFVRFEDLLGLFDDRLLYEANYYPHYRGYFRLGIEAGFFN